ncbi:MAG: hypothetical protein AUH15_02265 [Acidobacteriales bacterium 13_2_20CM_55_8]|nr:MAG: hypothetical protein AUH15_02265 [Acidobacteriales bacterium 13_2_20CM_55_8]
MASGYSQAEMRPLVIVVPEKLLDRTTASVEGKQPTAVQTFVVDGTKETFDFAVALRGIGPKQTVRQAVQDLFEKLGGGTAGLLGRDPSHRLAAEVIDGGEFKVVAGVAQGRQELNIEVEQFSWPLFFVTPRTRTDWMRQAILSEASKNALHAAVSETELGSNASRPPAPLTQTQDLLFETYVLVHNS